MGGTEFDEVEQGGGYGRLERTDALDLFVGALMERMMAEAKADEGGFVFDEQAQIHICLTVIGSVMPMMLRGDSLSDCVFDFVAGVITPTDEAGGNGKDGLRRKGTKRPERGDGLIEIEPFTQQANLR